VTTPTEANRAILGDGKAGFLAATNDKWVRALTRLRDDPRLRGEMAAASRDLVQRNYSLTTTAGGLVGPSVCGAGKTYPPEIGSTARPDHPTGAVSIAINRDARQQPRRTKIAAPANDRSRRIPLKKSDLK
jgi:hypothetical protein